MQKGLYAILIGIFILSLILRFIYFPNNVYFGYDQARDSYVSLEILKGHLKLIGPPSSVDERLFHGPLIYYIYAPIYLFSHMNPEVVSGVFRIINSLCVLLAFLIGASIFNTSVGIIAALLFAVSFEQTQYSLFLSHPSLAVATVLTYYLGLSMAIFKNQQWGLVIAATGLGLSIQFHYVNLFLLVGFTTCLIIFRKQLYLRKKIILFTLGVFLLTISSFIIAEIKFNFRGTRAIL